MCLLKEESSQARIAPTKHQEVTLTLLRFPSPPIPSPPAVPRGTQGNMNCQRWLYWLWGGMTTADVGLPYFCALLVVIQSQPPSSSPSQILVLSLGYFFFFAHKSLLAHFSVAPDSSFCPLPPPSPCLSYVVHVGLEIGIVLPKPPECWNYGLVPPCPAWFMWL